MSISKLELKNFTVFADAKFEFCPGIRPRLGLARRECSPARA
jgi:hypothetical protein